MRSRATQLACLLLLLTSVSLAEASAQHAELRQSGNYITVLLRQGAASDAPAGALPLGLVLQQQTAAPVAPARLRTVWSMRPPAAHSAQVHSVTGSGI
ncbi:MAG: hypothetical protein KGK08_07465 [Acidobacteriota bacterium]|nr:hypothetical protein [Acidobacteriota bacterium]